VAYAKANPGKLRCGNIGYGSATHLTALLFEKHSGVKMTYVPYRGGMATMPDILTGNIDCAFLTVLDVLSAGKTDEIVELAVASPVREPLLPTVPTMAEAGYPDVTVTSWLGLIGPSNLPKNVQDRLTTALAEVAADLAVKDRFDKLALRSAPLTGEAFRKAVIDEYDTWDSVMQFAHLKA
jgi:tripartite-type tricarboxylate transporter receptor subunit TctC